MYVRTESPLDHVVLNGYRWEVGEFLAGPIRVASVEAYNRTHGVTFPYKRMYVDPAAPGGPVSNLPLAHRVATNGLEIECRPSAGRGRPGPARGGEAKRLPSGAQEGPGQDETLRGGDG